MDFNFLFLVFKKIPNTIPVCANDAAKISGLIMSNPVVETLLITSFAQTGIVFGIFLKTKNKKLKSISLPAAISGIFGVTEPAIYGITLPRKKMFIHLIKYRLILDLNYR